jgi:hypothetical protein
VIEIATMELLAECHMIAITTINPDRGLLTCLVYLPGL